MSTQEIITRLAELKKDHPTFDKVEIWDEIFALEKELVDRDEHAALNYGRQSDDWS